MTRLVALDAPGLIDDLQRSKFARYLLDVIRRVDAAEGAVVGLEGAWGTGKTWVLRQIQVVSAEAPGDELVFINFNPWMVSGAADLVNALLQQIAAQFGENKRSPRAFAAKVVEGVGRYAKALTAIKYLAPAVSVVVPGAGLVLEAVAEVAQRTTDIADPVSGTIDPSQNKKPAASLQTLRADLDALLRKSKRRIVVVVDDLDRITPTEMASMTQAIKAVANFPNVIYVLAYARETVAHALETALDVKDGAAFLEKVVQHEVELPPVPARRLQAHAVDRLRASIPELVLSPHETADLEFALPIAASLMQTPRDVARLHTRLSIVLPALAGEVNLADITVAEAIRLKVPNVALWIDKHPGLVTDLGMARYDSALDARLFAHLKLLPGVDKSKEENDRRRDELQQELRRFVPIDGGANGPYQRALEFLFEAVKEWHVSARPDRSDFRRLQRFCHWYQWRCLCDHQEPITVQDVQALMREPRRLITQGWLRSRDAFTEVCRQICDLARTDLSCADSKGWLIVMLEAQRLWGPLAIADLGDGYGPAPAFVAALRLDGDDARRATMVSTIDDASLAFSGLLLVDLHREEGSRFELKTFDDATLTELTKRWCARIGAALASPPGVGGAEDLCPYIYCCWMQEFKRPTEEILRQASLAIAGDANRLAGFFASLSDRPHHKDFGLDVQWSLLPPPHELLALAKQSSAFQQSHSNLYRQLEQRATSTAIE